MTFDWNAASSPPSVKLLSVTGNDDGSIWLAAHYNTSTFETDIYKSTDSGSTWSLSSSIAKPIEEDMIEIGYGNGIWLVVYLNEIYRSADNGNSWNSVFSSSDNLFFGTSTSKSGMIWTDNEGTWIILENQFFNNSISFVRSVDQGLTWTKEDINIDHAASIVEYDGTLYLFGTDVSSGSWVVTTSADGGATWSSFATTDKADLLGVVRTRNRFADVHDGVWISSDGVSWSQIITNSNWLGGSSDVVHNVSEGPRIVSLQGDGLIAWSEDDGDSWDFATDFQNGDDFVVGKVDVRDIGGDLLWVAVNQAFLSGSEVVLSTTAPISALPPRFWTGLVQATEVRRE